MNYDKFYIKPEPKPVPMDQLIQLVRIVADGDLISKDDRDDLVRRGFCQRAEGFNIITHKGISHLYSAGRLAE